MHTQLQRLLQKLEGAKQDLGGHSWKAAAVEFSKEQEQLEGYARHLLAKSRRAKVHPEIKLYFDERKSEAFGEALEGLLELARRRQEVADPRTVR